MKMMHWLIIAVALLAVLVAVYPPPTRPKIRLNGVEKALPSGYVVRYSVNGQSHFEIMPDETDVNRYIDYLKEVGDVE